jgi:lysozyme
MKTSKKGLELIAEFEGFSPTIYKDVAGYPTIGFGHLLKENEEKLFQNGITKEQAYELLAKDVKEAENAIIKYVRVPLTQNQFDALVSFVYNVGSGNFQKSTLLKELNAKNYAKAADEFLKWTKAGGKEYKGLVRRRQKERELFLS